MWRAALFRRVLQRSRFGGKGSLNRPLYPRFHRTFALPTSHLLRFMFGFRLKAKPEHEAKEVARW